MPYANINSKELFFTLTPADQSSRPSRFCLLLIHGLGSSSSFFQPIIPSLTSQGYRCLTFDTYGSGCSFYTGAGNSTAAIATDALALLDSQGITENVVVIGHSMGGIVASLLVAQNSTSQRLFEAVILIGPVNPNPTAAEVFEERIRLVEKDGMEPLAASIPTAATGRNSTPLVHAFIRSLLLGTSPAGYISLCKAIAESAVPAYEKIKVPLLIIAGAEDKSAPMVGIEHIMEKYASSKKEMRTLEGVGHWHVLEAFSQVQGMIVDFLRDLNIQD